MNNITTLAQAAHELACTFEVLTGLRPRVAIKPDREADGTRLIAVAYPGDELVRAMQIEAFVVEKGERILHRSQGRNGQTILAYFLVPRTAGYHLSTVKPPRVVPAGERHKWSGPALRGGAPVHCLNCGCKKAQRRDYTVLYVAPGGRLQTELRPPCTGKPVTPQPA